MNILGSLGLDQVESDPNNVPAGRYVGIVESSRIVLSKDKSKVMHVTNYRVTEGDHKGAQLADFQTLGTDPQFDEAGNITSFTNTMSEANKQWYKKRLVVDLGVPEDAVNSGTFDIENLKGKQVVFGVKHNNGYQNVSFVELRTDAPSAATSEGGIEGLL